MRPETHVLKYSFKYSFIGVHVADTADYFTTGNFRVAKKFKFVIKSLRIALRTGFNYLHQLGFASVNSIAEASRLALRPTIRDGPLH